MRSLCLHCKSKEELEKDFRSALIFALWTAVVLQSLYWGLVLLPPSGSWDTYRALLAVIASLLLTGLPTLGVYLVMGGGDCAPVPDGRKAELLRYVNDYPALQDYRDKVVAAGREFTWGEFLAIRRWVYREQQDKTVREINEQLYGARK